MTTKSKTPTPAGVWVLTTEHNEYDQHGEYFCAVWPEKPTVEQLAEHSQYNTSASVSGGVMGALSFLLHLKNGGGRRRTEQQWYHLKFVEFGKNMEA